MSVQTAIIAVLGLSSSSIYNIGFINLYGNKLNLGLIVLGILWTLCSIFACSILVSWQNVTKAGKEYVRFKRMQLSGLEKLAGVENIGLSNQESEWLETKKEYHPFSTIKSAKKFKIGVIIPDSGWQTIEKSIFFIRLLWIVILVIGSSLIFLGIYGSISSN